MTRYRFWMLDCDEKLDPGCWETIGPEDTSAEVVRAAIESGWDVGYRKDSGDACPYCREHRVVGIPSDVLEEVNGPRTVG